MNLRNAENYNIGLDIGTGSVGWAVTDENGELYHFKKKPTWGSRLFPSAESAAAARIPRGQRRRIIRRRRRLDLLQGFFAEEMQGIDPDFFIRLNQSRLLPRDRKEGCSDYRWPLFNSDPFDEKEYYNRFPTIYHLRTWLMEADEKADLRLVYLALHNIVKVRGNFLHQDDPKLSAETANMKDSVSQLCETLMAWCEEHDIDCACKPKAIQQVLEDKTKKRAEKRDEVAELLGMGTAEKKRAKELAGCILGYKVNFGTIFDIEGEKLSFDLKNDESVEAFLEVCPDDATALFEAMQAAYSSYILGGILKEANGKTISYCKVAEYERYGRDLETLKALVREYAPKEYDEFFRGPHYEAPYSRDYDAGKVRGYTRYNLGTSKASYDDFRKEVEKLFAGTAAVDDERYQTMTQSFLDGAFLRRLKTSDNGSIPYQLHLEEMRKIIDSQGKHYPFLLEQRDKIESLVSFRIPYYVGPLTIKNAAVDPSTGERRFAWSVRKEGKEDAAVYPWNWEEVIDKDKSAENFIRRMTGTCTYLQGEPVLPRCSLLYEKFCVLNEFNGARWSQDGDDFHRFSTDYRFSIYDELFKHGSVTYKKVEEWLERHGHPHAHVKGGQGETKFESKLSSHMFFAKLLEVEEFTDAQEHMIEEIILWNTLFEDRGILKERIRQEYGDVLDDGQIKKICKKRFTGWGRLSEKLLCGLKAETPDGPRSIMDILVEGDPVGKHIGSSMVLMEILHEEKLGFENLIDEFNKEKAAESGGLKIEDLPGSPALRRSVNQAQRIVREIVGIAGTPPANIYIEVTRDDDERNKGKRTKRRFDNIKEALRNLKAEGKETLREMGGFEAGEFNDDALALYFAQNGKCLYCGKPIDVRSVVAGDQAYQVDHIIPQSYIKDDSLENRVLVCSSCNQRKTNLLLLDPAIRSSMRGTWTALHDAGLMGDKKYNNLMRDRISDKQMKGFINRQLVETSQIVKFVQLLLREEYPETNIRPIKASLSSQLRDAKGYVKCREANNYHHAHDALLACEIGRFIEYRFGNIFDNPIAAQKAMDKYVRQQGEEFKKTHRMPGSASFIVGSFVRTEAFDSETGEILWDAEAECERIRKYLNYKDCFISRMPEVTSGTYWDATIYSPKSSTKKLTLPLKQGLDPDVYGSYSSEKFAYFFVYEAEKNGERVYQFAPVPVAYSELSSNNPGYLAHFAGSLAEEESMKFIRIVKDRICKYQLVEIDGGTFYITGKDELRNGTEIAFSLCDLARFKLICDGRDVGPEEALSVFETICHSLLRYSKRLANNIRIKEWADEFTNLNFQEQRAVILALTDLASANKNKVDLTMVGRAKTAGQLKIAFSGVLNNDGMVFVNQSVTGMFETRQSIGL